MSWPSPCGECSPTTIFSLLMRLEILSSNNSNSLNLRTTKDRHNQTETLPEMAVEWIRLADVMLPPSTNRDVTPE